jgi:hypothetical protein
MLIHFFTCPTQFVKILVEVQTHCQSIDGLAGKTSHPRLVAVEQMVQRTVNGFEKCPQVTFAIPVRDAGADSIQFIVHPLIVLRHQYIMRVIYHDKLPWLLTTR